MLVFNTVFGLSVEDLSEGGGPFLGVDACTFVKPVYVGDTLIARSTVLNARESKGQAGYGIVTWHTVGTNQTWRNRDRVQSHQSGPQTGTLRSMSLTGTSNYFEDFVPGDVMRHARGKTMCEQDNVGITLMVLNTAEGHFNEDVMQRSGMGGRGWTQRLQFGGVTIAMVIGMSMQDTGENALAELSLDKIRLEIAGVPRRHAVRLYGSVGEDRCAASRRRHRHVQTLGRESERRGRVRRRTARADQTPQPLRSLT